MKSSKRTMSNSIIYLYCKWSGVTNNEPLFESNSTKWLYDASDIIYPSVYMTEQMPPNVRLAMIRGRVRESIRLAWRSRNPEQKKVIAYHRYLFSDTRNLLNERETFDALNTIKASGANGVILWGSSFDLNSRFRISVRFTSGICSLIFCTWCNRRKCTEFYEYLDNTLGPVAHSLSSRAYAKEVSPPLVAEEQDVIEPSL